MHLLPGAKRSYQKTMISGIKTNQAGYFLREFAEHKLSQAIPTKKFFYYSLMDIYQLQEQTQIKQQTESPCCEANAHFICESQSQRFAKT